MSSDGMQPDPGASGSHAVDALKPGDEILGRYRILKKLGEGGMGEVYAAEHVHISKRVAIKLLRAEVASNKEAVTRFAQEARSASSIGHKNIIGIDDFGTMPDGRIYLSMEFLDGMPLNDMIKQPGGLPADRLLNILIQTGHGLSAAHARNIVHRDMKPENIFVTYGPSGEDVPKLLDFGIAKVAGNDGQNNLTKTGTIFGTPFYMAPEQAMGQHIDGRVDVYAMGVIMYEVFAGSLPFRGESFMGILTQHITTEPDPVLNRAALAGRMIPPGMPEIIARAMAKDPERRYRTMDELVNDLVGVYRMVAGSGMSQYMEAHTPPRSAMMPTPTASGMPAHTGGYGAPTPHGMPGMGMPPPPPPPGSAPFGRIVSADESTVMPARKSKAGMIAAIVIALAVIGGGVTVFLVSQNKSSGDGEGDGTGTGSVAVIVPDAGTGVGVGTGTGTGTGTGVVAATPDAGAVAVVIDAGVAVAAVDAAVAVVQAPDAAPVVVKVDPIPVLLDCNASAKIFENGKQIGKCPELIKVIPGESRTLVLKSKGYKDATVVLDGSKSEHKATLEKKSGGGSGTGTGTGTGTKPPPEDPRKAFCKKHPDDLRCEIVP